MGILKSDVKFTEPFVGEREVIVMLSVQGGQATASATKLDYYAVHALEQMIVHLTFIADTPQTEYQRKVQEAEHRMANTIADMTPQTDCPWK